MGTFGQASGPIDPIAPVLLSQKGSLFLTRPILFHDIQRRDALEASANELFTPPPPPPPPILGQLTQI